MQSILGYSSRDKKQKEMTYEILLLMDERFKHENGNVPLLCTSEVNNLRSMSLDVLLQKYKELFDEKLWLHKSQKIELKIDPNCKHIFI